MPGEIQTGGLHRSLGLFSLTMLGVGATIGTGIFFVLAEAVPKAGPAVILSFLIAAVTAGLTALCYAELSFRIPAAGSSYSYAYATVGEFIAYIVAACLLLEYALAGSAVAIGWSEYLNNFLQNAFGWGIPEFLRTPSIVSGEHGAEFHSGRINLPPIVLIFMCGFLLLRGARESATANAVLVVVKLAILVFFVAIALYGFNMENFRPFFNTGKGMAGMAGVTAAAGTVFFSFIGLDTTATAGEEVKNPTRNVPLGILWALSIVTVFLPVCRGRRAGRAARGQIRRPGSGAGSNPAKRHRQDLAGADPVGGGGDLGVQRDPSHHLRPDAHPLRHQPRRPDPRFLPEARSAHPGAGVQYRHRLPGGGAGRGLRRLGVHVGHGEQWAPWLRFPWCRRRCRCCAPKASASRARDFACRSVPTWCRASAFLPASISSRPVIRDFLGVSPSGW
ncbi:MAG: amino acid permease [Rhodospirillales bacterium]